MPTLIGIVDLVTTILVVLLMIDVLLSFFLPPYNPIRRILDTFFEPMLNPIRRLLPQTGVLDFSPIVLALAIQLAGGLLQQVLQGLA